MGLGPGFKKGWGWAKGLKRAEEGAGPAVPRGSTWGGGCLGMPACGSWLRSERKGLPQAAASSKEQPVPAAGKDPSQPSPAERTTGTWCRELGAPMGRTREPPCLWEASWERSIGAPGRARQPALWRRKGQGPREKPRGAEGLPAVAGAAVSRASLACLRAPLCRASPDLCLPPCLYLPLSPFQAVWLPKAFCPSASAALHTVAFYVSFLCLSLPSSPPAIISLFPALPSSALLGKMAFRGLPLRSDLSLFSVAPSALHPVYFFLVNCPYFSLFLLS